MPFTLSVTHENPKHRLLAKAKLVCKADATAVSEAKGSVAGDRKWQIPDGTKTLAIEVTVPSPSGGTPLVDTTQVFTVAPGPPIKLTFTKLEPRFTLGAGFGVEKKAVAAFRLTLDLRFLDVTAHAAAKGATYTPKHKSRFVLLEYTGGGPTCWAVLVPPAVPQANGNPDPGTMLFLRPTGKAKYTNSDDVKDGLDAMFPRYVANQATSPPSELGGPSAFPEYNNCGWERQLVASKKEAIFLFPLPHGTDHGDAGGPRAASLCRSAVTALWDAQRIGKGGTIKPGRLAVGGYSHGGRVVMGMIAHASNHAAIDEAFLFDPASFPALEDGVVAWFDKGGKTMRMIAGGYQHKPMLALLPKLTKGTASVWPDKADYWFRSTIYHTGISRSGGPIETLVAVGTPAPVDSASATTGFFQESYKIDPTDPIGKTTLVVIAPATRKGKRTLTGVALEEAAAILHHTMIPLYGGGEPVTDKTFDTVFTRITANESAGEPKRIGSIRHEWTVYGGMDVGGKYVGFFQRCLESSGFR